jgi:steroid delta-isomerase-like uncharacterized protein
MRATADSTNGAFCLMEHWEMAPGFGSPYHTHHREDESFYVLEGEIAFVCGGQWQKAGPGTFVYGPREIPHGFKVVGSAPARMLLMCAPGGFEDFVLAQRTPIDAPPSEPDMARLAALAAKAGIDIHGPLPEEPESFHRPGPCTDTVSLNRAWIDAFNRRDWETESALRTPDFCAHLSGASEPLGFDAWSGFLQGFAAAFPDSAIVIESSVSQGDTVAVRWTLTGTHQGEFQGIPATGRAIRLHGIEYNRFAGDRCAEHWSMYDNLALLRQLGVMQ